MKWIAKAIVQKAISIFPQRERLNLFFQRYVTKGVELTDAHFGYKVMHARDHLANFKAYGKPSEDKLIFELGTGWYPVVPMLLYLTDCGQVLSADLQDWLRKEGQLATIDKLIEWRSNGKLAPYFPTINEHKWSVLKEISENPAAYDKAKINATIGLTTMLGDAAQSNIDAASIDFICSNNTFEHVHPGALKEILSEFKRIVKPGGVMSHFIDLSDHFAHFDTSLTIYNFLKFSRKQWALIDNSIQPQNRWRWKDYRRLYEELELPITSESIRPGDLNALAQVRVHSEFQDYTPMELAISHGYLISVC